MCTSIVMNRAAKSGLAKEAYEKVVSKYSKERAHEALEWISQLIGESFDTSGDMQNFQAQLHDGQKLCKYVLFFSLN